jgi:D-glycero-D-manno-heptose 1,7-bisphosphate phosphatase
MKGQFRSQGIALDAVYFCPHHPEQGQGSYKQFCECRKPQPGMLLQGIAEFGLEPDRCVMFGDKVSDLEAAKAAGIGRKVLVGSQRDVATNVSPLADQIWQSIAEAKRRF